jgi:hypothetical protein
MTGGRGRRRKQPLDDLEERPEHCKLKEEALDRAVTYSLWKRLWSCRKTEYRMNNE